MGWMKQSSANYQTRTTSPRRLFCLRYIEKYLLEPISEKWRSSVPKTVVCRHKLIQAPLRS